MTQNKKQKVAVLIDTNIGGRAGAELHLKTLCESLDSERFSVDVYQLGVKVPVTSGQVGIATVFHTPIKSLVSLSGAVEVCKLLTILRRGQYDCILSFFEKSDLINGYFGKACGARITVSSRRDTGFRHGRRMRWAYKGINRRIDTVVAASSAVYKSLVASGCDKSKIVVIKNGVYIDPFLRPEGPDIRAELNLDEKCPVITCVANLSEIKNHDLLVRAIAGINHRGQLQPHLLLVGDGVLMNGLKELADDLGVRKFIHFLGARHDIPRVLAGTDIVALASWTEGLPNCLLEASAAARPVVATNVGGVGEVVEHQSTGLLVPPGDLEQFEVSLEKLMKDPLLARAYGQNGRAKVTAEFSINAMVDGYSYHLIQSTPGV